MFSYNVRNLIYDADFKTKIANELYWVPINILGKTQYANEYFINYLHSDPTQIREIVHNVYEAFQYFNAKQFKEEGGIDYYEEDGYIWGHHTNGYDAIIRNKGCCTSIASAMKYLIRDYYEYVGYLFFIRPDRSNHVIIYIKYKDLYYIFDPSASTYGQIEDISRENGNLNELSGKIITSICFETNSVDTFVRYHNRRNLYKNHKFVHLNLFDRENSLDKAIFEKKDGTVHVYFPKDMEYEIIGPDYSDIYIFHPI